MYSCDKSTLIKFLPCFALVAVLLISFMEFLPKFVMLGGASGGDIIKGHMLPLGHHREPEEGMDVLHDFPHPKEFYLEYVVQSKPALFKGLAKDMPAYTLWNDDYLSTKFGHLSVSVETGKKENRQNPMLHLNMKQFIARYDKEDLYMVQDILSVENSVTEMISELSFPRIFQCGNFQRVLMNVIMWFSSGGTNSVLHTDTLDNINCIFSGTKQLFMVDKKYGLHEKFDRPGGHSGVNVESVNMHKYPEFLDVPWYNVTMETGDCLFIPYLWSHNVRSSNTRNLAVNFWMAHLGFFNESDCENKILKKYIPLNEVQLADIKHVFIQALIASFNDFDVVKKDIFIDIMSAMEEEEVNRKSNEEFSSLFTELDSNNDRMLTKEEVLSCNMSIFDPFIQSEMLDSGYSKDELRKSTPKAGTENDCDYALLFGLTKIMRELTFEEITDEFNGKNQTV
ncbi:JmjC domain-containing protein 5 [Nymphon striatum]|nr:JmjC domain-containing protein 5 [Nymphon striatum]